MSLANDRIDDADIGPLWAKHFPRIKDYPRSKVIVLALVYIIEDTAKRLATDGNWSDRVSQELRRHGIPAGQFWEVHGVASR